MKRKIIAAIFTGMLTAALFPAIAHAEIENPEDYMGIWYANYVIYSDESSERHNVAEYLNQYLEMRLMEDGSAYMEMSYNSEESDSAEILKVSWKLEDGKILVSLEEGDIYLDTVDGEFVGSLDEDTQVIFGRELVQTGEAQSLDHLDNLEDSEKAKIPKENPYIYHPETDKYDLKWSDQYMITIASALHDIGKVGIDEEILNKPGRLTNEEFEEMKKHTLIGASMLKSLGVYQDEELVKVAYQICRWHHERYDGKGYPDGLKGEEIPIAAQVVSVADVYDALTSERVYKKAFSHEKAMEMILAGECGTFNPLLLECLQDIQGNIQVEMKRAAEQPMLVQNSYVGKMIETVQ